MSQTLCLWPAQEEKRTSDTHIYTDPHAIVVKQEYHNGASPANAMHVLLTSATEAFVVLLG